MGDVMHRLVHNVMHRPKRDMVHRLVHDMMRGALRHMMHGCGRDVMRGRGGGLGQRRRSARGDEWKGEAERGQKLFAERAHEIWLQPKALPTGTREVRCRTSRNRLTH